jgi:hypothetical protein
VADGDVEDAPRLHQAPLHFVTNLNSSVPEMRRGFVVYMRNVMTIAKQAVHHIDKNAVLYNVLSCKRQRKITIHAKKEK